MRIIVFSDSHKNFFALKNIVRAQKNADIFLHLGDGESDFIELEREYPKNKMYSVCGNCDWMPASPIERIIEVEGKRIFMAHGHKFDVKYGLKSFKAYARQLKVDIALFGHTHYVYTEYDSGIYYMNPGSVTNPIEGGPSYGIIDITSSGIFLNIIQINTKSSKNA